MATNAYAYSYTYERTHSVVFLSDNLRNTLREVIRENGLSPDKLMQDWETIERGIRTWLDSRHLERLILEVHRGGALVNRWDFDIESIADHQIGVGILLEPPDWGFFGYLGAGKNAWSYDAFEGAIVTETKAIHSGLPTIRKRGNVTVHLDLKKKNECVFVVNGVRTPAISLPRQAVVIPAACLLKKGQVVTLANFGRLQ